MAGGEGAQAVLVGNGHRLEVAQHQCGHRAFQPLADRQFNLWQPVALVHAADQRAQRHQQRAEGRRQYRADLHVGHVAALALVETDQHRALARHVAHRQPGPVAIAPTRALDRTQQVFGLDLAQVLQVVFEHPLLDGYLRCRVEMLHLAAAAGTGVQAEVRTARSHALRAFAPHRRHHALLPCVLAAAHVHLHLFAGQRAFDEHHLALGIAGHALGF